MDYEQRISARLDEAVRQAAASVPPRTTTRGPLGVLRRKYLIHRCRELAAQYHLQAQLDGFVYARGREALTGLDLAALEQLEALLADAACRVATVCDAPAGPPAR